MCAEMYNALLESWKNPQKGATQTDVAETSVVCHCPGAARRVGVADIETGSGDDVGEALPEGSLRSWGIALGGYLIFNCAGWIT